MKICDFDLGSGVKLNSACTPITTPELTTPVRDLLWFLCFFCSTRNQFFSSLEETFQTAYCHYTQCWAVISSKCTCGKYCLLCQSQSKYTKAQELTVLILLLASTWHIGPAHLLHNQKGKLLCPFLCAYGQTLNLSLVFISPCFGSVAKPMS